MRFHLVDRIELIVPNRSIRVVRNLSLAEEYLGDHFPGFPVMPGVLMLQVLVEAASWLIRAGDDFAHSVVVLRETKHVKYGTFMEPGKRLVAHVDRVKEENGLVVCKGRGEVGGAACVSAQIGLVRYNLRDHNPAWDARDQRLVREFREQFEWLTRPEHPAGPAAARPGSSPAPASAAAQAQ